MHTNTGNDVIILVIKVRHTIYLLSFLYIYDPHLLQFQFRFRNHFSSQSSLSYSFMLVAGWWLSYAYGFPPHCGEVKMLVHTVRNVLFLLRKNLEHLAWQTEFCGTPGQSCLKHTKQGWMVSLYLAKLVYRISHFDIQFCNVVLSGSLF